MTMNLKLFVTIALIFGLQGCSTMLPATSLPELAYTPLSADLENLPAAKQPLVVGVYGFRDLTGQKKPSETVADMSTAVTQGGGAILVDALMRAANGQWFQVVEREGVQNLLQERQLIRATRSEYDNKAPLEPLLLAGAMLEGGIISYDTNTITSGAGIRIAGIGGNRDARVDEVTVNLRLVSVLSGRVLKSITVRKSVVSTKTQANVYKYWNDNTIVELEGGYSENEPMQYAVRQAIQKAVYALIMEGAETGIWEFSDSSKGELLLNEYISQRSSSSKQPRPPRSKS